ncbi:MAG TPA: cell division protein FtsH, partial [Gemmatimonadales bacterium]
VKRILDQAYERARVILAGHRDLLDRIAAALLERETVDREDLALLVRGEALPPSPPSPRPARPLAAVPPKTAPQPAPGPVLGTPPAEPAGA